MKIQHWMAPRKSLSLPLPAWLHTYSFSTFSALLGEPRAFCFLESQFSVPLMVDKCLCQISPFLNASTALMTSSLSRELPSWAHIHKHKCVSPFLKMKYNSHMASKNGWNWVSILKVHRRITSICVCQDTIKRQTRDISSIPQDDISLSPNIVSCFFQLSTCGYAGKWKLLSMCGRGWLPQTACLVTLSQSSLQVAPWQKSYSDLLMSLYVEQTLSFCVLMPDIASSHG